MRTQALIDAVVGTCRVIADVGRIGTIGPEESRVLIDPQSSALRRCGRVIGARAALGYQVAVMLEHVEMVFDHDPLEFARRPGRGRRYAQVNRNALERLAVLPSCRRIGDQPIARDRIIDGEGTGLLRSAGLCPVDPQAKPEAVLVSIIGNRGNAMRKLCRVSLPIAHAAKPARVQMKHLQSKPRRFLDHAVRERLIHRHAAAPAVIDQQWVGRIA